jgi:hypothetical protein
MTVKITTPETTPEQETSKSPTEEPKKDIMGMERDDKNTRLSFTPDGNLMILTMPLAHMSPASAHGFLYMLHDTIRKWYSDRYEEQQKNKILTRDAISKFSFKKGVSNLFK